MRLIGHGNSRGHLDAAGFDGGGRCRCGQRGCHHDAAYRRLGIALLQAADDTRLRKLADGEFDAIVLARAGLQRLEREQAASAVLDPARFVPAPGQGTLALEGRADDAPVREAAAAIGDADALSCLLAERALARALGASCDTPLGALAKIEDEPRALSLRAWIGLPDGSAWIEDELNGDTAEPEALALLLAARLELAGARELLSAAEEPSVAPWGAGRSTGAR